MNRIATELSSNESLKGLVDGLLGRQCNPGGQAFSKHIITLDLTTRDFRRDAFAYVVAYFQGLDERLAHKLKW